MQEEIFGPVLVSTTFRTPAEAVELANNTRYGLAATRLDRERQPRARHRAEAGGGRGLGQRHQHVRRGRRLRRRARKRLRPRRRLGGAAGLYPRPTGKARGAEAGGAGAQRRRRPRRRALDRTAKLYIGGKQARPDGGYSRAVWSAEGRLLGQSAIANRKDIRNAVEAAQAAQRLVADHRPHRGRRSSTTSPRTSSAGAEEFAARLRDMTGASAKAAEAEVEAAVDRLFT